MANQAYWNRRYAEGRFEEFIGPDLTKLWRLFQRVLPHDAPNREESLQAFQKAAIEAASTWKEIKKAVAPQPFGDYFVCPMCNRVWKAQGPTKHAESCPVKEWK